MIAATIVPAMIFPAMGDFLKSYFILSSWRATALLFLLQAAAGAFLKSIYNTNPAPASANAVPGVNFPELAHMPNW